tara:strand:- start:42 stop:170 length:129 start_codon:yes stop_codon:yes gene_type:complete
MEYDTLTIIDIIGRCMLVVGLVSGMVLFITTNVRYKDKDIEK